MADLSKPKEAAEWVAAWEAHLLPKGCDAMLLRKLSGARDSLALSARVCEVQGRWPSGWVPDDVRASLALLDAAVERHS